MEIIWGQSAHSKYRLNKLLTELKNRVTIDSITSQYVYFVDIKENKTLSQDDLNTLSILFNNSAELLDGKLNDNCYVVVPRLGTISPWSSKATDITKTCGVKSLNRVERGIVYFFKGTQKVDADKIKSILHDKMMEQVFSDFNFLDGLFSHQSPAPYKTIDVMGQGKSALVKANSELGLALSNDEIDYLVDA
ncbi:MAG TPA: phosphoribosylformylglycinamidine synthase, partial [Thiomicrospira sp.]|nr:phosphoribosylformylglycinamidine synthase [Thiomicrospira sp.]